MHDSSPTTLHFWPGTTVVTFMVQNGEDILVTVVPPQRFLEGLAAASLQFRFPELCRVDESEAEPMLRAGQRLL